MQDAGTPGCEENSPLWNTAKLSWMQVQVCKYPVGVLERSQRPDGVANVLRGKVGQLMQSVAAQQGEEV